MAKTNEQILLRIADLHDRLARAREECKKAQTSSAFADALQKRARLEGNIGALDWVLRDFEHLENDPDVPQTYGQGEMPR